MTAPLRATETMPGLHPELAALLAVPAAGGPTVAEARAAFLARYSAVPRVEVAHVEDRAIEGPLGSLRLRIYRPDLGEVRPVLVYLHGGGFVLGDLDSHDALCRRLCHESRTVVVSVDYALAPEHRFPAGLEDCIAAVRWVARHARAIGGDPGRLALGGDSAGANLAIACALQSRGSGGPVFAALLLAYPVTDAPDRSRPSYSERGEGFGLTAAAMYWFFDHYLDDPARADAPLVSPLHAQDLSGLPPAWLLTAEFDPLRDEGRAFAERLSRAGVAVEHVHFPDVNHGFLAWAGTNEPSARGIAAVCDWLKTRLA